MAEEIISRDTKLERLIKLAKRLGPKVKLANQKPTIKDLDDLARIYIRLRDDLTCQKCGKKDGKLEVSHFYSRAIKSTRWDEDNLVLLCFRDHYCWAHQRPDEFSKWFIDRIGKQKFEKLQMRANDTSKIDRSAIGLYLNQLIIKEKKEVR